MRTIRRWAGVAATACLLVAAPAGGHPHPDEPEPNWEEVLDGLERGMVALEQIGRERELDMLRRVADEVRRHMRVRRVVDHRVEGQLEALRLAMHAFREEGRIEAIELAERAIHARELYLEGRRDREAREIERRAPKRERCMELMELAANLYREYGALDRAGRVRRLSREHWPPRDEVRRERERRGEREGGSARELEHRMEIMRHALPALMEADRPDAAEQLERAIHALEMDVHGRRDHEAAMIRDNAPGLGAQIEILQLASGLWREFGHHERAVVVGELAEHLAAESRGRGRREPPRRPEVNDDDRRRLERLQQRFDRLERALEDVRRRLRENERGR